MPQKGYGTLLADVQPDNVGWLWPKWVPLKCVTWLVGMPGVGKSTFLADLAARVTRDDVMPDGTLCGAPGGVILIGMEEMIAEQVVPRAVAAGARLDRISDLSHPTRDKIVPGEKSDAPFNILKDMAILKAEIRRVRATLVIIDPFLAAVDAKTHLWANQVASDVFMLIQGLAEELGVAIVIINHFTKRSRAGRQGVELLENMQGGATLGQRARAAVLIAPDETDGGRVVISQLKHSLSPAMPAITARHNGFKYEYLTGVTPDQEAQDEARRESSYRQRVIAMLKGDRRWWTLQEIMAELGDGANYNTVKSICKRLADDAKIERNAERGFYKFPAPAPRKAPKRP